MKEPITNNPTPIQLQEITEMMEQANNLTIGDIEEMQTKSMIDLLFTVTKEKMVRINPRTKEERVFYREHYVSMLDSNIKISCSKPILKSYLKVKFTNKQKDVIIGEFKSMLKDEDWCSTKDDIEKVKYALVLLEKENLRSDEVALIVSLVDEHIVFCFCDYDFADVEKYIGFELAQIWENIYRED